MLDSGDHEQPSCLRTDWDSPSAGGDSDPAEQDRSVDRYRLIAESTMDVLALSRGGQIVWMSPSFTSTFGWTPDEYEGRDCTAFVDPDHCDGIQEDLLAVESGIRTTAKRRVRMLDSTGHFHWVDVHAGPFRGAGNEPDGVVSTIRIVDDLVDEQQRLAQLIQFDALTGLLNRTEVLHLLDAFGGHDRRPGDHLAVVFCDVDGFKGVNDALGHIAGDAVLRAVAERIRVSVRGGDAVARIGGDEFLIVLPGVHDLDEPRRIAEKVRESVATPLLLSGRQYEMSISVGVTLMRSTDTIEELIARADEAMYASKRNGRNKVTVLP